MRSDFVREIGGHSLEYIDELHLYLIDGVIAPSVSGILAKKFGHKYDGIDRAVLQRAANEGTRVHESIEKLIAAGEVDDIPEVKSFIWLKEKYGFKVLGSEIPVLLFKDGYPVAAGRLDLVLGNNETQVIADIKRTAVLDKEYVAYQTNIYRIAYQQSYGGEVGELRAIHLRGDIRKYVKLPINERMAWNLIDDYLKGEAE